MKLRHIAHSRTGDKGNTSNISVIAFDFKNYEFLREQVTAERVRAHFAQIVHGTVTRYEMPSIGALNFVLTKALGGGVTRSLALDAHGKGLSSALLDMDLSDSRAWFSAEFVQKPFEITEERAMRVIDPAAADLDQLQP